MTECSFEACFREHFPRLVALGESMAGNSGVAHECAQEAFIRLHDRWDEVSTYESPGTWLRRVMSNLLIDHHRSRTAERRAVERLGNRARRHDGADRLGFDGWLELVAVLPARQRLIVSLFYGFDLSIAEIAETVEVSENTVKSSLSKARTKLRTRMEADRAE